jgi:hypothetical protein
MPNAESPCCFAKQMLLNISKMEKKETFINTTSLRWTYTLFYRTTVVKESAMNAGLNYTVNY